MVLFTVSVAGQQMEGPVRPSSQYDQVRMSAVDGAGVQPRLLSQQMEAVSTPVLPGNDLTPVHSHVM